MGGRKISIFCGISLNRCGILRGIWIMGGIGGTILKIILFENNIKGTVLNTIISVSQNSWSKRVKHKEIQ